MSASIAPASSKTRQILFGLMTRLRNRLLGLVGGKSVGARAVVLHENGQVLLIRHTYKNGWHTIGGGVDRGETACQAVIRELREEAGIYVTAPPELFGLYYHPWLGIDDHVALYVVRAFEEKPFSSPEIAEARWCDPDNLPPGTNRPTRERLAEILQGAARAEIW